MTRDWFADVTAAWSRGKGALLYGPPGTGKTRAIADLFRRLDEPQQDSVVLEADDPKVPLRPYTAVTIPQPVKVVWVTFHQSYTYEDFVVGLRPVPTSDGVRLEPRLGVLLDAVYELIGPDPAFGSVVLFIDELNRGNAARIFGEFLTFLDVEYRDTDASGQQNALRLPLPLPQLGTDGAKTEPLRRPSGDSVALPSPSYFPRHVYVVATMNSVDRAAIPIDSALARRFERIEMRPDMEVLAGHFGVALGDVEAAATAARTPDDDAWQSLTAYACAILLLDRLNAYLAVELGSEFELGHGLLMTAVADDENTRWHRLAVTWDDVLYPQIEDRLAGRPEQLLDLLKVDDPPGGDYAWSFRTPLGGGAPLRALAPVRLAALDIATIRRSLQWLAR